MNAHQQLTQLLKEVYRPDETPLHQLRILSGITGTRLTLIRVDLRNLNITETPITPITPLPPASVDPDTEPPPPQPQP